MSKVKITNHLNRDDYWMGMAFFVTAGSNNSIPQGAVLLGSNSELLSIAYSGFQKVSDIPAEINALLSAKVSSQGGTLYLTHTPDYNSALAIAAACVKRLVYFSDEKIENRCLDTLRSAHIQLEEFQGNLNWMRDYIKTLDTLEIFNGQNDK